MIKKIKYIYQFLYFSSVNSYSWLSFFPLLSIILGSVIILTTLGVMDAMEASIVKRMESFEFTFTGDLIEDELDENVFDVYQGNVKKYLLFKKDIHKVVTVNSFSDFNRFKHSHIKDFLTTSVPEQGIMIGRGLAYTLGIKVGDSLNIASPLDFDLLTSSIPHKVVLVSAIFNYNILDYDYNYAFMPIDVFGDINNKIFIKSYGSEVPSYLIDKYSLINWRDNHLEFLKALNLEKLLYSFFGYLVIIIASASSTSLMSLFIIKKSNQIAILKTLGIKDGLIMIIFTINALGTSFLGVALGSFIYMIFSIIDNKVNFMQNTLFNSSIINFSINFNYAYIYPIFFIACFMMVIAAIYPSVTILKANSSSLLNKRF